MHSSAKCWWFVSCVDSQSSQQKARVAARLMEDEAKKAFAHSSQGKTVSTSTDTGSGSKCIGKQVKISVVLAVCELLMCIAVKMKHYLVTYDLLLKLLLKVKFGVQVYSKTVTFQDID